LTAPPFARIVLPSQGREGDRRVAGTYQFDQAADYSLVQLADLVSEAFRGYALPVYESAARLARLIRMQGLDLASSVVVRSDAQLVGISFLGLRNTRAWVSAFGIVPSFRGRGLAGTLMERITDRARTAGAQDIRLEVLVGNLVARRVYGRSGFRPLRDLVTLERAPGASSLPQRSHLHVERVEVDVAMRCAVALEQTPACWQREAPSLVTGSANGLLVRYGSRSVGCAFYTTRDGAVALHHICATNEQASAAIGAVLTYLVGSTPTAGRHVTLLNEPDPKGLVGALSSHGFRETMRQLELKLEL
jgi:RimJ/RimL family protein N-acetyltransferase